MSASTAIGMVSTSLRNLLVGEMELNLTVEVTVLAPDEHAGDRRVNLFLYRVAENPHLKNSEPRVVPGPPARLVPAPLPLQLYYLLTAYAPNDPLSGNATAHQILGEAMRVLGEFGVVPPEYLDPGLQGAREQLQIVSRSLEPEELSRIWTTFGQPFRLSVLYEVSTVEIDVRTDGGEPVPAQIRRIGVPDVRQPLNRPVVTDLAPLASAPGARVTFRGEHLSGWRASVLFGGRVVLDREPLSDDAITATVPGDVVPGLYDVRVDVSGLFRRTYAFEVTG